MLKQGLNYVVLASPVFTGIPASTSQVLRLMACATMSGCKFLMGLVFILQDERVLKTVSTDSALLSCMLKDGKKNENKA